MIRKIKKVVMFIYFLYILANFNRELAKKGFKEVFQDYSTQYSKVGKRSENISNAQLNKIVRYFEMLDVACAWYPKKSDCIHKTFLGYKFLRQQYGIPVEIVIGIRKFPFQAHAWLRLEEENFFVNEEDTTNYKIILSSCTEAGEA